MIVKFIRPEDWQTLVDAAEISEAPGPQVDQDGWPFIDVNGTRFYAKRRPGEDEDEHRSLKDPEDA